MAKSTQIPSNLEELFIAFLRSDKRFELIDDIEHKLPPGIEVADALAFSRMCVIEIKTISEIRDDKVDEILDQHRDRDDFPVFYGSVRSDKILTHLSDGEQIYWKIWNRVKRPIEKLFSKANRQLDSTKNEFNLNESTPGILIILNEGSELFDPNNISGVCLHFLQKIRDDGTRRFSHIDAVIYISHVHAVAGPKNDVVLPILELLAKEISPDAARYVSVLVARWAAYRQTPLFRREINSENAAAGFEFLASFENKNRVQQIISGDLPQYEHWRLDYQSNPYLRALANVDLARHGTALMDIMIPMFSVGGSASLTQRTEMMRGFTHFMCEMEYRGLDWRILGRVR